MIAHENVSGPVGMRPQYPETPACGVSRTKPPTFGSGRPFESMNSGAGSCGSVTVTTMSLALKTMGVGVQSKTGMFR